MSVYDVAAIDRLNSLPARLTFNVWFFFIAHMWYCISVLKRPVYIFAFGEYNFKQVNVIGIQIFRAQLLALNLR